MAETELVRVLQRLVEIPSVNPALGNEPAVCGEQKLAEFLAGLLADRGFELTWQDRETGRPNLVALFGDADPRRTLLIECHMDTVGVDGMREPFHPRILDGRLYGRGACDDKGPMAAGLVALTPVALERVRRAGWRVIFAAVMGEETGNEGAAKLVRSGLRADRAIVLEPTDLAIIHTHKGALWMEIEVMGVAAHGSSPELGLNAVQGMVDVVRRLEELMARERGRMSDALLGAPTLSLGMIRGGTAVNVVPDRCVLQVDRRTLPGEDHEDVLGDVRKMLEQVKRDGRIRDYELRMLKEGLPFRTSAESGLVRLLQAACRDAGVEGSRRGAAWYSDAGLLSEVCGEVVVFGPGGIGQAHTTEEYIELDSLEAGCNVLRRFLERLAEEPP